MPKRKTDAIDDFVDHFLRNSDDLKPVVMADAEMDRLVHQHMRFASDGEAELFRRFVRRGVSPLLASMHATGSIPGTGHTDRALMQDKLNGQDMSSPVWRMRAREVEKKHPGLTKGRTYFPSLARHPNDPGAWCGSYSELIEQAKRSGKGIEGVIEPAQGPDPTPGPALSDNAINSHLRREIMDDPSLWGDKKRLKKLREDVINRHTPRWRKKLLKG